MLIIAGVVYYTANTGEHHCETSENSNKQLLEFFDAYLEAKSAYHVTEEKEKAQCDLSPEIDHAPDLAETAEKFEQLGMANVAGAELYFIKDRYVFMKHPLDSTVSLDYAWKVSNTLLANEEHASTFIINGAEVVHAIETEKDIADKLEKGCLERLICAVMESLATYQQKSYYQPVQPGHYFCFALQLHQHGETEAAFEIMQKLVEKFGSGMPEASARYVLSEALYRNALSSFRETGDWGQFYTDVEKVLDTGLKTWLWHGGISHMSSQVEAIAFHGGTPLPDGHAFTPEEAALIKEWEAHSEIDPPQCKLTREPHELWLIPETWENLTLPCSEIERTIRAMGVTALPMLAALAGEFTKETHTITPRGSGRHEMVWFPRPMLRNEKARQVILDILPMSAYRQDGPCYAKKNAGELALDFYNKHKDSPPEVLAMQYVCRPDGHLNDKALNFIGKFSRAQAVPELESLFKTAPIIARSSAAPWEISLSTLSYLAVYYAACRGPGNEQILKDFADRLLKTVLTTPVLDSYQKAIHEEMKHFAVELLKADLSASDDDVWKIFNATPNVWNPWRVGVSAVSINTIFLTARLDAMPFKDMYLTVLAQTDSWQSERHMALLCRRILNEGGPEKVRESISATDGRDDWTRIFKYDKKSHGLNMHMWIFDEKPLMEIKLLTPDTDYHNPRRCHVIRKPEDMEILMERSLARLNGISEEQLSKPPWKIGNNEN